MRPLTIFGSIATAMVAWLSTRMWCGDSLAVWRVSCVLGAWAPLGAAAVFHYIRVHGHREHTVLAAWLVRAIGMHCVLVWLVGISDWLRGPPQLVPVANADAVVPLVFVGFAPVFALSALLLHWALRVSARLSGVRPTTHATPVLAPYRGLRATTTATRAPTPAMPWAALTAGLLAGAWGAWADGSITNLLDGPVSPLMRWPLFAAAGAALYLLAMELRLQVVRTRTIATTAR